MTLARWTDEAPDGPEARAARLLRVARQLPTPAPPAFSRESEAPRRSRRLSRRAAVLLLLPIGAIAALLPRWAKRGPEAAASRVESAVPLSPVAPPPVREATEAATPKAPKEVPPPAVPAVALTKTASARPVPSRSAPADTSGIPVPRLTEEARMLREALAALKHGQPEAALEQIQRYRSQFPAGVLGLEAVLAEVRAHRAMHHLDDALGALDRAAAYGAYTLELGVLRGEVLAESGDCTAASRVLDLVLLERPMGVIEERAVATRAECSQSRGEPEATRWLERYLARWPHGGFAAKARWMLEKHAQGEETADPEGAR